MTEPASSARPVVVAIRYLAIIAGGACLLLTAVCFAIACQFFIQTGVFAQSYAMVGSISGVLGDIGAEAGERVEVGFRKLLRMEPRIAVAPWKGPNHGWNKRAAGPIQATSSPDLRLIAT